MNIYETIPGLKEAIDRERNVRDQSFLELTESICGVEVKPLTLRRMLTLTSIGSPFMLGGTVDPYHVAAFFLVMTDAKGFARWRLLRKIGNMDCQEVVDGIKAFLDESMQDAPPSSNSSGESYYSFSAAIIDILANQYGWSKSQIMDEPLKCLFQYVKAIAKRNNPDGIQFNPSDRVRGQWLKEINANSGRN